MKIINRFNIVILIISGILFLLALRGYYYTFTYPFILTSLLNLVLSISYLKFRKNLIYIINGLVFSILFIPANYAITKWPGGDDGGGLFWSFFVVSGSFLALVLGLIFSAVTLGLYIKRKLSKTTPNNV